MPIFDLNGVIEKFLSMRFEITAQKNAQKRIMESEKMSPFGQMVAGVPYEINSPLFAIDAKIKKIIRSLGSGILDIKTMPKDLKKLQSNVQRVAKIIKGLKRFSQNAEDDPNRLYCNQEIINESLELCYERFRAYSVELRLHPVPEVTLECWATQISQVLLNVLSNSYDAISNLTEKWIDLQVLDLCSSIVITVKDSGHGIPA